MAQPPKNFKAKGRHPNYIGYNNWMALPFQPVALAANMVTSAVSAVLPLGLHMKFTHLSVFLDQSGTTPVTEAVRVNVVSGMGAYETGTPSYGGFLLGGTFAAQTGVLYGETVTLTIGGLVFVYPVTTRVTGSLTAMAADIADYLNTRASTLPNMGGTLFGSLYRAAAYGPYVSFSPLLATAQTTAYTVATNSAAGTVTAQAGTLVAGAAGSAPVPATSDTTYIGLVPSTVASAGQALFAVDQTILTDAAQVSTIGNFYALDTYDSVFSSRSVITLRVATGTIEAGILRAVLYGMPQDIRPMEPQESNGVFRPAWHVI